MRAKWTIGLTVLAALLIMPLGYQSEAKKPEGKLVIAYTTLGSESTDIVKWNAREQEAITMALGEALVLFRRDKEGNIYFKPAIASSWKVSKDIKSFEFTIRKDVRFHDGTPVTVEDILYTWNRVLKSPLSISGSARRYLDSVEAVGDDRVVFHLKEPWPFWIDIVSGYPIQPKAYTEKIGEKEFANKPVYAGPWKFVKQVQGDYIEMEAFEGHYRKVPYAKKLILKVVPETSTKLAMLKTGEADMLFNVPPGPAFAELKADPNLKIVTKATTGETYGYFTNLAKPNKPASPFWDKRVRWALSYGLNRQLLIDKIYHGMAKPSYIACIIPGSPQWHPDAKPIPYDVDKAKALLAEAGYADGLEINFLSNARVKTQVEAIANMWQKIGVKSKITMMEVGTMLVQLRKRTLPDGIRLSYHYSNPVGISLYFRTGQTYNMMVDEKLDQLTRKMMSFPEGPEMNDFIKNEMCMYVYDLVPNLPIVIPLTVHGVNPKLGIDEWVKEGAASRNYGAAAEYLKPRK